MQNVLNDVIIQKKSHVLSLINLNLVLKLETLEQNNENISPGRQDTPKIQKNNSSRANIRKH